MIDREQQIGICGTFDVENYGDLLFPLIAERELLQRLGRAKLHRFSYRHKAAPDWPYDVNSLVGLPGMMGNLDGLMIGGGDLIRFDKEVAPGYRPLSGHIHHPTGYWLTPALIALQHGRPVVWNAPGVHGEIPNWAESLVDLAINSSSYVAVRDIASCQALNRFARNVEIKVVPDTAFGVAQLVDPERPSADYSHLCQTLGLCGPYIVIQARTGLEAFSRLVRNHPHIFQGYQLVVLPIGPILGDDAAVFGDDLPGSVRLTTWLNPLLLTELIGRAAAVVGISLHLAIVALAFGVPVFRPTEFVHEKYGILLDFDTVAFFDNTSEIDPHWFAAKLEKTGPSQKVFAAIEQLTKHWDQIASIFISGEGNPVASESLGHFWQSMPDLLETWATHYELALAERDMVYKSNSWKITAPLRALRSILWRYINQ